MAGKRLILIYCCQKYLFVRAKIIKWLTGPRTDSLFTKARHAKTEKCQSHLNTSHSSPQSWWYFIPLINNTAIVRHAFASEFSASLSKFMWLKQALFVSLE